ncbi:UNVERIFIED_CONTAM: hypothetical protein HDU68_001078 [Siphonaria sp. JEL0065]|nr:hypothetical protein HDU68_001078 [Siphonaria sp. JEL0065]
MVWSYFHHYHLRSSSLRVVKTEADIVSSVQNAIASKSRIRAMGSLYTFVNVVQPTPSHSPTGQDIILDMREYNQVLKVDKENCRITLANCGNVNGQTIGGVISTDTHGESVHRGGFSSFVKTLRIVDGFGAVRVVDFENESAEKQAFGCSLGLLGVVSNVELKCVPLFVLKRIETRKRFDWVLENWDELHKSSDYLELSWIPILDTVIVAQSFKLSQDAAQDHAELEHPIKRPAATPNYPGIVFPLLTFLLWLCQLLCTFSYGRKAAAWIASTVYETKKPFTKVYISYASDAISDKQRLPLPHHEMELQIPFKDSKTAIIALRDWFNENPSQKHAFLIDLRSGKGNQFFLSGAYGQDTLFMDFLEPKPKFLQTDYYERVTLLLKDKVVSKRHWGKISLMTKEDVEHVYGEQLVAFKKIPAEFDPYGLFRNPYYDQYFYDHMEV